MKQPTLPTWAMDGVVAEIRELKTKNNDTWAHVVQLHAMGGTYELMTKNPDLVKNLGEGEAVHATGGFQTYQGSIKLMVHDFMTETVKSAKPKLAGAS
ncbi:MAG: hypothetical protein AAF356_01785 [Planctomycetota bacterium]